MQKYIDIHIMFNVSTTYLGVVVSLYTIIVRGIDQSIVHSMSGTNNDRIAYARIFSNKHGRLTLIGFFFCYSQQMCTQNLYLYLFGMN